MVGEWVVKIVCRIITQTHTVFVQLVNGLVPCDNISQLVNHVTRAHTSYDIHTVGGKYLNMVHEKVTQI